MRTSRHIKFMVAVEAADKNTITERWRHGRAILTDPTLMAPSGKSLKNGALEKIIGQAKSKGIKLTEREIRYRLEIARAYPTQGQIRHACAEFEGWAAIRDKGFPDIPRDPDEPDYDPRWTAEKESDAARKTTQLLPADEDEQLALFPDDQFGPLSTLAEMVKYADEMREWTNRQARRDNERQNYLRRLAAAVGGDLSRTWEQAREALALQGGA